MKTIIVTVHGHGTLPPPFNMKAPLVISATQDYITKLENLGFRIEYNTLVQTDDNTIEEEVIDNAEEITITTEDKKEEVIDNAEEIIKNAKDAGFKEEAYNNKPTTKTTKKATTKKSTTKKQTKKNS